MSDDETTSTNFINLNQQGNLFTGGGIEETNQIVIIHIVTGEYIIGLIKAISYQEIVMQQPFQLIIQAQGNSMNVALGPFPMIVASEARKTPNRSIAFSRAAIMYKIKAPIPLENNYRKINNMPLLPENSLV